MPASTAENLSLVNGKLRFVLRGWQSKPGEPGAFVPTVFTDLLSALQCAAELLRGISCHDAPDSQLQKEIADYCRNVQELEKALPAMHERLLVERARLESARAHLKSVAAWAETRRKTL